MGIVKFDLLALGALNGLHMSVDAVKEAHGVDIDLAVIPQEAGHIRHADSRRYGRGVPGGVEGADGDSATDEAKDVLRPGRRSGADPARSHPGSFGASVSAQEKRGGGGGAIRIPLPSLS